MIDRKSSQELEYDYLQDVDEKDDGGARSGFYASQDERHDLRKNMPLYTGYSQEEMKNEIHFRERK